MVLNVEFKALFGHRLPFDKPPKQEARLPVGLGGRGIRSVRILHPIIVVGRMTVVKRLDFRLIFPVFKKLLVNILLDYPTLYTQL